MKRTSGGDIKPYPAVIAGKKPVGFRKGDRPAALGALVGDFKVHKS
jgi:hypothetical protein